MQGSIFLLLFIGACFQPLQGIDFELNILEKYVYKAEVTFEPNTHKGSMRINNVGEDKCLEFKRALNFERGRIEDPRNTDLHEFFTAKETGTENYRGVYGVTKIRYEEKSEGEEIHHSISFQFSWMGRADGQPHAYALIVDETNEFLCYAAVDLPRRKINVWEKYPGFHKSWSGLYSLKLHALQKKIDARSKVDGNQFLLVGPLREKLGNVSLDQLQRHYVISPNKNFQGEHFSEEDGKHLTYKFTKLESFMEMYSVKVNEEGREMDGVLYEKGEEQRLVISEAYYFTTTEILEKTRDTLKGLQLGKRDAPFVSVRGPWKTRPNEEFDIWMSLPNLYDVELGVDEDGYATLTLSFSPRPKYEVKIEGENGYCHFTGKGFVSSTKGYLVSPSDTFLLPGSRDLNGLKGCLEEVAIQKFVGSIKGPLPEAAVLPWMPIRRLKLQDTNFSQNNQVFPGMVLTFSIPPSEPWDNLYVVAFGPLIFAGTFDRNAGHLIIRADLPPATSYTHSGVSLTDEVLKDMRAAIPKVTNNVPLCRVSGPLSRWPESLHSLQWTRVTITTMTEIIEEGKIVGVDCKCSDTDLLTKTKKFAARVRPDVRHSFPVELDEERREIIIPQVFSDGDLNPRNLKILKEKLVRHAKDAYEKKTESSDAGGFLLLSQEMMIDVSQFTGDSGRSIFGVARIEEIKDKFGFTSLRFRYLSDNLDKSFTMGYARFEGVEGLVLGVMNERGKTREFEVRVKYGGTLEKSFGLNELVRLFDPTIQKSATPDSSTGQPSEGRRVESLPIDNKVESGSSSKAHHSKEMKSSVAEAALNEKSKPPVTFFLNGPFDSTQHKELHDKLARDENALEECKPKQKMVVTNVRYTEDDIPLLTIEYTPATQ